MNKKVRLNRISKIYNKSVINKNASALISAWILNKILRIKGHDPSSPSGFHLTSVTVEEEMAFIKAILEFQAQTAVESIYEPATAAYYIGDALWKHDFKGAAFEGLASAIPFLPKRIGDKILGFILPTSWHSIEHLKRDLDALEKLDDEISFAKFERIRQELNRRGRLLEEAEEAVGKKSKALTMADQPLLPGPTMGRAIDDASAPKSLKRPGAKDSYSWDKDTKMTICDRTKLGSLDDVARSGDAYRIKEYVNGGQRVHVDFDEAYGSIDFSSKSKFGLEEPYLSRDVVEYARKNHGKTSEEIKDILVRDIKKTVDDRSNMLLNARKRLKHAEMEKSLNFPYDEVRDDIRKLSDDVERGMDLIKEVTVKHKEVHRKRSRKTSLEVVQFQNEVRNSSQIDMSNLPSLFSRELQDRRLEIYSVPISSNLHIRLERGDVDLPKNFLKDGDSIYYVVPDIPVSSLDKETLMIYREISIINETNKLTTNVNEYVRSVSFH